MNDNRISDDNGFWAWFDLQRGNISVREVERRAGVPRGRIGNTRSGGWRPTLDVCQAVAAGLRMPVKDVLKKAGVVARTEPGTEREETLLAQFRLLGNQDQRIIVDMVNALVNYREDNKGEVVPPPVIYRQ